MPRNWPTWRQFGKIQPNLTPLHMDLFNFLDLTVRYRIMNVDFCSNFEYHIYSCKGEDSNPFEKERFT